MGRCIVKLDDWYLEWSTVVDAPVSYGYHRADAEVRWGLDRVARADERGTSWTDWMSETAEQCISCNRAGPDEEELTKEQIIARYCIIGEADGP